MGWFDLLGKKKDWYIVVEIDVVVVVVYDGSKNVKW